MPVGRKVYVPGARHRRRRRRRSRPPGLADDDRPVVARSRGRPRPTASRPTPVETTLYVACGLLDASFAAARPGQGRGDRHHHRHMTGSFDLPAANPIGFFVRTPTSSTFGGDLVDRPGAELHRLRDRLSGPGQRRARRRRPTAAPRPTPTSAAWPTTTRSAPTARAVDRRHRLRRSFDLSGHLASLDLGTGTLGAPMTRAGQVITDVAACPGGWAVVVDGTFGAAGVQGLQGRRRGDHRRARHRRHAGYGNNLTCF